MELNKKFGLSGKIAIITGASKGLGKAMAEALASAGEELVINSRHLKEIKKAGQDISKKTGKKVVPVEIDISESKGADELVKIALDHFGKIDILVNNAGAMVRAPMSDVKDEDINRLIDTNLKGPMYLCRAVAKEMISNRWGRVINIGSLHSIVSIPQRPVYAATKGGILQFSKSLALEWAKYGITVNVICPGVFRTEINMDWMNDPSKAEPMLAKIPMGYFGEPEDLAGAVVFLASDESRYITGSALIVDGGYTVQ